MITPAPVLPFSSLADWRASLPGSIKRLVLTNGCFDILHAGHATYLQEARNLGDFLVVAVNSDASVRSLKGEGRPVNSAEDRCAVLSHLRQVDAVTVFDSLRVTATILALRPDVYVKGGDYTPETLDPGEYAALQECKSEIRLVSLVAGKSTTRILEKIGNRPC